MAETEHNLRLKIVLDDTDLQNKLRNLNNQKITVANNTSYANIGGVGNIASLAPLAAYGSMSKAILEIAKSTPTLIKSLDKQIAVAKQGIVGPGRTIEQMMSSAADSISLKVRKGLLLKGGMDIGFAAAARLQFNLDQGRTLSWNIGGKIPEKWANAWNKYYGGTLPAGIELMSRGDMNTLQANEIKRITLTKQKQMLNAYNPFLIQNGRTSSALKKSGGGKGLGGMRQIGTFLAGQAIPYLTDSAAQYMSPGAGDATRFAGNVAGGALTGAGMGVMIGSIVPGIGTAIGAGVGALIGGGIEAIKKSPAQEAEEEARKQRLAFAKSLNTTGYDLQNYETKTRGYTDEKIDAEIKSFEEATKRQAKVLEANTRAMKKMAEDGIAPSSEFISQLAEQEKKLQDDQSRLDILNQEKESRLGGVGPISRNFEALSNLQRMGMSAVGKANYAQDIQKNTAYILQYVKDMSRKGFSARYA